MIHVSFQPGGEAGQVEPGRTILGIAEQLGVPLTAPCGGRGRCGRCRVIVNGGASEPSRAERNLLADEELGEGVRLACNARLLEDAEVIVPAGSRTLGTKILTEESRRRLELSPNVVARRLELPEPSLEDQRSDAGRIAEGLGVPAGELRIDHSALRQLPVVLRANDFAGTAIMVGDVLAAVLPPDDQPCCLGAAIDIGTTTVVAYLVDLCTGERVATASALNPQARHGHDVISRIEHVQTSASGLEDMRRAIVDLINRLLGEAVAEAGAQRGDIYEVTVVGNTCMHHLFLGLDPSNLGQAPYVPVVRQPVSISPRDAGLAINPAGSVYCLPVIAGFVGADTVAVLLVSRITERSHPSLAIDIGTNAEVMLWSGERLLVTSCAAGPAFEGGEISHGVRAAEGAIEYVWLYNGHVEYATIADAAPNGICGSGIVDTVATLLDARAMDRTGRLVDAETAEKLTGPIAGSLRGEGSEREFLLAPSAGNGGREIVFTQRDVRQVQLAKGAVRAAVELLCAEAGIEVAQVKEVFLAGAFGNYIDRRSAARMGLLPDIPIDAIESIGNAAGAGALSALISLDERRRAMELAQEAEYVELMADPQFQMVFADSMFFPTSD
ncbi:MAG: ASKHA domain-containing protein [Armatimonadota bacterium]|nr:ASKHA domain-containing protein [Armatimonadota bacterium]